MTLDVLTISQKQTKDIHTNIKRRNIKRLRNQIMQRVISGDSNKHENKAKKISREEEDNHIQIRRRRKPR